MRSLGMRQGCGLLSSGGAAHRGRQIHSEFPAVECRTGQSVALLGAIRPKHRSSGDPPPPVQLLRFTGFEIVPGAT